MNKELVQFALQKFTSGPDKILVCWNPKLIKTEALDSDNIIYFIDTSHFQPEQVLQCWIYQDGQLEECSQERYFEYRTVKGSKEIECVGFSILEQQLIVRIVWAWTGGNVPRASSCGGADVLQKVNDNWVEVPEAAYFWRT